MVDDSWIMRPGVFQVGQRFCQLSYSMFEICEKATTIRYSIGWKEIRKNDENNSKDNNVDRLLPKSLISIDGEGYRDGL